MRSMADPFGCLELERQIEMARSAGGISQKQLQKQGCAPGAYWYDEITGYWIPDGVLLFRPVPAERDQAEKKARDMLELPA